MTNTKTNILLVDDHPLVLEGLKNILKHEEKINLIFEASNGEEALNILEKNDIELVISDISMPKMSGIELAKKIKARDKQVKFLILTIHKDREYIKAMLELDIDGYVLKNSERQVIANTIKKIINGSTCYDDEILSILKEGMKTESQTHFVKLTKREIEVVKLICEELSSEEIANKLFISKHSIDAYRKSIIQKLGVKNAIGIMRYAIAEKLL